MTHPHDDLETWLAEGWLRVEAMAWQHWRFTLRQAGQWRASGVADAFTAAQWRVAGVDPSTVGDWIAAKVSVSDAVRWHEFGFTLRQAREYLRQGFGPDVVYHRLTRPEQARRVPAHGMFGRLSEHAVGVLLGSGISMAVLDSYVDLNWTDFTAMPWVERGITALDAQRWVMLGLTPAEARELQEAGRSPVDVRRDWQSAGIPADEVAEWLGAGLTLDEALEHRAAGVTAMEATMWRALRRSGGVDD